MGFEAEVSEQQRNYEKHRSHQELPGFAMLPKPLLFRNHDCVNTKPGLINCSCFQREKKKKNNGFLLGCLFSCFNMKLNFWTLHLQLGCVPGLADALLVTSSFLRKTHARMVQTSLSASSLIFSSCTCKTFWV